MNIIKIPNTEAKKDILKRIKECISDTDTFISQSIVNKLFIESHMEYEGTDSYCVIQLTWYDDNSRRMIKFHTHRDGYYMVDWIFIDNESKGCEAMFGITDKEIFFEMDS